MIFAAIGAIGAPQTVERAPMRAGKLRIVICTMAAMVSLACLAGGDPLTVDFRYKPYKWRTLICAPTDPIKTLVWNSGMLDNVDDVKLVPTPAPNAQWVSQELVSPRVPIAVTHKRAGTLEIVEEAFVSPIAGDPARVKLPFLQLIGGGGTVRDWAAPKTPCEPAFRNAACEHKGIVHYRFPAKKGAAYTVVFGFCEGADNPPGARLLDIEVEAKLRRRLDLAGEYGRNVPVLIPMEARDEDGDGLVDLAIAPDNDCRDPWSLLNVLWVFEGKPSLNLEELLAGRSHVPPLAHVACGDAADRQVLSPSVNVILLRLRNTGATVARTAPEFVVQSPDAARPGPQAVVCGQWTLTGTEPFADVKVEPGKATMRFSARSLAPGAERVVAVSLWREAKTGEVPHTAAQAIAMRNSAQHYWNQLSLPYDRIQVPDAGIQNLMEGSLRSIYQNRDYKNGKPVYQVGPVGYRDISCADGTFFCELGVLLGRAQDTSDTLDYFLSFQRANGRLWVYRDYWKENGLITWSLVRYAQLTGDKLWLEKRWRRVEGMVRFIQELRRRSKLNPDALNYGLIPDGFGDGGTEGLCAEYTNPLWDLIGLRAAVAGAKMLGKGGQAAQWQQDVDEMEGYLRKDMKRDARKDEHGNLYLPNLMGSDGSVPPPRGQWACLQSIFPGKLYDRDDPLVLGTLAMLEAAQVEGLPVDTGWMAGGLWPYLGHFVANDWLWVGQGQKAAPLLYAIANHAAPMLDWWEEQLPRDKGSQVRGDMPHNWGSVEFIRQVRYMLVLERGSELHLFEGLPPAWTKPGMVTRMKNVLTEFGPVSFALEVSADGSQAELKLAVPERVHPSRVVLHLDGWSGRSGTLDLPAKGRVKRVLQLRRQFGGLSGP